MIDVKTAVRNALSFMDDLYDEVDVQHARLEEVELSEDDRYWYVTISIGARPSSAFEAVSQVKDRDFKVVKVGAEDGKVDSMRIGTLSDREDIETPA
jgi:hypothetical protein